MDFSQALIEFKSGKEISCAGWNGKGMWLAYSPGIKALPAERFGQARTVSMRQPNGGTAHVLPCIAMKTAAGEVLMGWLASQTDMLAEDWGVAE